MAEAWGDDLAVVPKAPSSVAEGSAPAVGAPRTETPRKGLAAKVGPADPDAAPEANGRAPVDWAAQDWGDLIPRLYLVAIWRLRRRRGAGLRLGEAEDLVNDAITKTIAGVRIWRAETCTLQQHLIGVIFSDISHAARSAASRLVIADHGRPERFTSWPPDVPDEAPNQEEILIFSSDQRRLLERLSGIDPRMGRMAALMLVHDVKETRDLCRLLGLAPAEVANLRKRIKRAAHAYLTENQS